MGVSLPSSLSSKDAPDTNAGILEVPKLPKGRGVASKEARDVFLLLFFRFCTGSTRVPIDGFSALPGPKNKIIKFSIELRKNKDEDLKCQKLIENFKTAKGKKIFM